MSQLRDGTSSPELPAQSIGWLNAKNSFYNLMMRRDPVLANRVPAPDYVDAVIGMIDELTKEIPVLERKRRATAFSAIFGHAEVKQERDENGFDLLDLEMTAYSDF